MGFSDYKKKRMDDKTEKLARLTRPIHSSPHERRALLAFCTHDITLLSCFFFLVRILRFFSHFNRLFRQTKSAPIWKPASERVCLPLNKCRTFGRMTAAKFPTSKPPVGHHSIAMVVLLGILVSPVLPRSEAVPQSSQQPKSRQKRILWVTEDGRLALPPGTTMVISPSLSMPFVRHPPKGFFSNITISLPFTIDFDKLGLTDNENPFGDVPPLLARSMGRAAGGVLADYIGNILEGRRGRRAADSRQPDIAGQLQGGERALLYLAVEELLENFGMDGRACLLRAICEVHAHPLRGFGLLGEMLKLFLSASKSPFAHLMEEYVDAEKAGRGIKGGPAECWPYMKDCPKSIFMPRHSPYSSDIDNEVPDEEVLAHHNPTVDM